MAQAQSTDGGTANNAACRNPPDVWSHPRFQSRYPSLRAASCNGIVQIWRFLGIEYLNAFNLSHLFHHILIVENRRTRLPAGRRLLTGGSTCKRGGLHWHFLNMRTFQCFQDNCNPYNTVCRRIPPGTGRKAFKGSTDTESANAGSHAAVRGGEGFVQIVVD